MKKKKKFCRRFRVDPKEKKKRRPYTWEEEQSSLFLLSLAIPFSAAMGVLDMLDSCRLIAVSIFSLFRRGKTLMTSFIVTRSSDS